MSIEPVSEHCISPRMINISILTLTEELLPRLLDTLVNAPCAGVRNDRGAVIPLLLFNSRFRYDREYGHRSLVREILPCMKCTLPFVLSHGAAIGSPQQAYLYTPCLRWSLKRSLHPVGAAGGLASSVHS